MKNRDIGAPKEIPQRSCLGCRTSRDKAVLLRFVLSPGNEVLPDLDNKLPGRGAYTCMNRNCLSLAVQQRQFKRSFKGDVDVMPEGELAELVSGRLHAKVMGLVGLANKAGVLISGGSMVSDAIKQKSKPALVLVAADVSAQVAEKIINTSVACGVTYRIFSDKESFGEILGKAPRSAVAVKKCGFSEQLLKAVDRYKNFLGEV